MTTISTNVSAQVHVREAHGDAECYEIVADPGTLAALERDWEALYRRAVRPYFSQSFPWCWTSWETIGKRRGRRLHCIVVRRVGRTVLIWPFVIHRFGPWRIARPLGPETTEYTSVLVEDGPEASARVAQAWNLLRATCGVDIIAFPLVHPDSILHRVLSAEPTPAYVEIDPASHIRHAEYANWDAYRLSLANDMKKGIARRRRRLKEKDELVFEPCVSAEYRGVAIDWILSQKHKWLSETKHRNPWLLTPEYRTFLTTMAERSDCSSGIIVSVLRSGDTIIAADLLRRDSVRVEDFLTAYDPAFAAYGPGQMILEDCLKWAFGQNLDFDLRIGGEAYKKQWTAERTEVFSYEFAHTLWGRFYVLVRNAQQHLRRLRSKVPQAWRKKIKAALGRGRPAH